MAKKQVKTKSVGHGDNIDYSIVRGHVTAKAFNEAFKAEGWNPGDRWTFSSGQLHHEYWFLGKTVYKKSEKGKHGAVPVTVGYW